MLDKCVLDRETYRVDTLLQEFQTAGQRLHVNQDPTPKTHTLSVRVGSELRREKSIDIDGGRVRAEIDPKNGSFYVKNLNYSSYIFVAYRTHCIRSR